jgi:hypothetical protein
MTTNTCLTGGRIEGVAGEDPPLPVPPPPEEDVPPPELELEGVEEAEVGATEDGEDEDGGKAGEGVGGTTACGLAEVGAGETTRTTGVPALWASGLTSEASTTPKASIDMVATARARGEGIERHLPAASTGAAAAPPDPAANAAGTAAASAVASPRARIASMRSAIAWGRPPRRAPHSTQ